MQAQSSDTAVVCGIHINAHTIIRNLKRINWPGRIVLLRHSSEPRGMAACLSPKIEECVADIDEEKELPSLLEKKYGEYGKVFILFTDERYHAAFAEWKQKHPDSSLRFQIGSVEHVQTILDRYLFSQFIEDNQLGQVPRTIPGDADPFKTFGSSFIIRPRLSWSGINARERVRLINNHIEYEKAIADFESRGLLRSDLSYQERLSIRNQDNVSICGWYGSTTRHFFCSRKVMQYPPNTGGGDVVELLDAPAKVMEQAANILSALNYEGPFELEFVFDLADKNFKVIELNPRFWMQQGLIEAVSGRALVSNCLELQPQTISERDKRLRYWVNPLYVPFRAAKGDFRSLRYLLSSQSCKPLTTTEALRYAMFFIRKNLRTGLFSGIGRT